MHFTQALLCSLSSVCPASQGSTTGSRKFILCCFPPAPGWGDGAQLPIRAPVPLGKQAHLAPRSSLEPHEAWSIPKHSSGATQSLEHPRRQSTLVSGDPRYQGTPTEPPRTRSILRGLEHPWCRSVPVEPPSAWSIPVPGESFVLAAGGRAEQRGRGGDGAGPRRVARAPVARGRGGGGDMAVAEAAEATVPCRVQYLEDADPFAFGSFPEPRRAPVYAVEEALALGAQLPALHRLVGAPLPVSGDGAAGGAPGGHRAGNGVGMAGYRGQGAQGSDGVSGQRSRCESRRGL